MEEEGAAEQEMEVEVEDRNLRARHEYAVSAASFRAAFAEHWCSSGRAGSRLSRGTPPLRGQYCRAHDGT